MNSYNCKELWSSLYHNFGQSFKIYIIDILEIQAAFIFRAEVHRFRNRLGYVDMLQRKGVKKGT
jgi:hypothetical protein